MTQTPLTGKAGFYIYIVECADGSYYTGWTVNLKKRLSVHNQGRGSRYTRCRLPVNMAYFEILSTKSQALKREFEIKKLTRREKESLVRGFTQKLTTINDGK